MALFDSFCQYGLTGKSGGAEDDYFHFCLFVDTKFCKMNALYLTQMRQNQPLANFCRMRVRVCRSIPKKEER
jgi:hypothetical protein